MCRMMSMEELLVSLTKKAKLEAEEAHRQLVAAINGQAGLHLIQGEVGVEICARCKVSMTVLIDFFPTANICLFYFSGWYDYQVTI